jgi:hypothetical protein
MMQEMLIADWWDLLILWLMSTITHPQHVSTRWWVTQMRRMATTKIDHCSRVISCTVPPHQHLSIFTHYLSLLYNNQSHSMNLFMLYLPPTPRRCCLGLIWSRQGTTLLFDAKHSFLEHSIHECGSFEINVWQTTWILQLLGLFWSLLADGSVFESRLQHDRPNDQTQSALLLL